MFNQGGLSLEQAPPLLVVLRFFITATLFGLLLGISLLAYSSELFYIDHTTQITLIHILAIGVMASFMFGALFQMLPVIAGVVIQTPTKKAMLILALLTTGLIMQLVTFNITVPLLYAISAFLLGGGLLHATTIMIRRVIKITDHSTSSKGMLLALISFSLAILLGIYLLLSLGGHLDATFLLNAKEAHYSFALFGWVTLLIVSISFQVVEMFYVTPKYPTLLSNYLPLTLFSILILKTLLIFSSINIQIVDALLAILFILYAGFTLYLLYKRKRPTSDATVWFWRLGMGLLIITMLLFLAETILGTDASLKLISYITFIGFALSIVFAMMYKIVPFLTWFHLSTQGYIEAPMMHEVIHPKKAKIHFAIHVTTLLLWGLTAFFSQFYILASLMIMVSFGWLLYHLIYAMKKYNYTQKHTEKMEW